MVKTHLVTDETLKNLLSGAEKLYKSVSVTMGPRGHNVIFRKAGARVGVTHDGVTVAKAITLQDPIEDVAADLMKEAAIKLDATTGDGTTTVTVLAYHILREAAKQIVLGTNPMIIKLQLDAAVEGIVEAIKAQANTSLKKKDLVNVATVASGSAEIGKAVGEAVHKAGKDTPVFLGFSDSSETITEVINGFKIASGPASPYLMDPSGARTELPSPYIIVVDAKLRDKEDIMPLLTLISAIAPPERKFLLICDDISNDALSLVVVNFLKGFAGAAVARVPAHISAKTEYLTDIAISTGATLLSRNSGNPISDPKIQDFGRAKSVIVEPLETIIVNGSAIKEDMDSHIESLKKLKRNSKNKGVRDFADDRLKTLEQSVLSIYVGGQSETDSEERHYRYEDAVGATRAAMREGIVPGGGTLLFSIAQEQDNPILKTALSAPISCILSNAGISVPEADTKIFAGVGIDVLNPDDGIVDLTARGIVDPAQSEIECVRTAVAIAGLLITSGAMIVDEAIKDEKTEQLSTFNTGG